MRGHLDKVRTSEIPIFEQKFLAHLKANHPKLLDTIARDGDLSKASDAELKAIIEQFIPESGIQMKS